MVDCEGGSLELYNSFAFVVFELICTSLPKFVLLFEFLIEIFESDEEGGCALNRSAADKDEYDGC